MTYSTFICGHKYHRYIFINMSYPCNTINCSIFQDNKGFFKELYCWEQETKETCVSWSAEYLTNREKRCNNGNILEVEFKVF